MAGIEASPIPSGAERVEVKDKESVETGPHTNSYATVQLRDDNWTSGFAIPGILPPPVGVGMVACSGHMADTCCAETSTVLVVLSTPRKQVPRQATVGQADLQRRGHFQEC